MKFFLTFWRDIRSGKNFDVYLAIIIALVVSILGIVGRVDQAIISSAVLATLALVANSLLINRRENEEIQKTLSSVNSDQNLAERFLKHEYNRTLLREILANSHEAFFWGPYLTTHILLLKDVIKERLPTDIGVRFLLMDPYGMTVNMRAEFRKDKDVSYIKKRIESSLFQLQDIADISQKKLKFRVLDYEQPYSIIAFDPYLPSGRMFVRLNSFDISNEKRPTFELIKERDIYWFEFFVAQFESVWKLAHDWSPETKEPDVKAVA